MKKIILAVTLLAVAGSQVPSAKANGWPIAAGVLGGLAVGTAIGAATAPRVYYAPQQVYYPSTTSYAYQPAPAAPAYQYQSAPAPIGNAPTVADAPAVSYYQPAPATVVYQSAPVVYSQPSYYYAPAPVFGFGFGFSPYWGWGGGYRGGYYGGYRGGYGGYHGGYHHR